MKYELVKIEELCGDKATIYSIRLNDSEDTLLNRFIENYKDSHLSEVKYIWEVLKVVSNETGYRENYFKPNEGFPGSQIEAIFDKPNSKLRLYFINLGKTILVIGDGGVKPKNIRALQESEELKENNYFLRQVSRDLEIKVQNREITFSPDFMRLLGNLIFGEDNE